MVVNAAVFPVHSLREYAISMLHDECNYSINSYEAGAIKVMQLGGTDVPERDCQCSSQQGEIGFTGRVRPVNTVD